MDPYRGKASLPNVFRSKFVKHFPSAKVRLSPHVQRTVLCLFYESRTLYKMYVIRGNLSMLERLTLAYRMGRQEIEKCQDKPGCHDVDAVCEKKVIDHLTITSQHQRRLERLNKQR